MRGPYLPFPAPVPASRSPRPAANQAEEAGSGAGAPLGAGEIYDFPKRPAGGPGSGFTAAAAARTERGLYGFRLAASGCGGRWPAAAFSGTGTLRGAGAAAPEEKSTRNCASS